MITAVVTKKGRILQNKQVNGADLTFTRVLAGTASTPVQELKEKTGITSIVQTLSIQSITQNEGEQSYTILVLLENTNVKSSYNLNQIGFYANDPDNGEILFAVAQFDTPKKIETSAVEPGYTLEMPFTFQNTGDANVKIDFEPDNLMSRAGVEAMLKSEEISGKASGNSVYIKDGAESPLLDFKLFGKCEQVKSNGYQLFNHNAEEFATLSTGGVIVRNNNDGTFTVSGEGKLTNNVSKYHYYTHAETLELFKAGKLNLKCSALTMPKVYVHPQIDGKSLSTLTPGNLTEFEITEEMLNNENFRIVLGIYANTGDTILPGTFSVMLYQDGDGTLEQFTDGKPAPAPDNTQGIKSTNNPAINIFGHNLCSKGAFNTMTSNGKDNTYDAATHKITVNEDTELHNFTGRYCKPLGNTFKIGKTYTLSFDIRGTRGRKVACGFDWKRTEIILTDTFTRYKVTKVADRADEVVSFYTVPTANDGLAAGEYMQFDNVQICLGESGDFEEYKPVQAIAPGYSNYLNGIPISEGGNYTDENGQQWICDEINLAKRKYIQRVKGEILNGTNLVPYHGTHANGQVYCAVYPAGIMPSSPILSSNYKAESWSNWNNSVYCIGGSIIFTDSRFTDEEAAKNIWADELPSVFYALETPIETDLTEEQIAIFEKLSSHENTTTIFMHGIGNMEVSYFKNTENGKAIGILKSEHIYLKQLIGNVSAAVADLAE